MSSEAFREEILPVAESIHRHVKDGYGVALMAFLKPTGGDEVDLSFLSPLEPEQVGAICKRILDSLGLGYDVPRSIVIPKVIGGRRG